MKHYSQERKDAVIQKMMPPINMSIATLSSESGITQSTLYNWRTHAKSKGLTVPGDRKNPEQWSSSSKFAVVIETAALNGAELAEYCRKKGLLVEQIVLWKQAFIGANANVAEQEKVQKAQSKEDKKRIKRLEVELRQKERTLAETAALLVLRKKANAIWGEDEDE
jgi:transposase-like protein